MKRRFSLSAVLSLVLISVLLTFAITNSLVSGEFNHKLEQLESDKIEYQKLSTVDAIIRENFAWKVDDTIQSESSIKGYVDGLGDQYSKYLSAEEYAAYLEDTASEQIYCLGFDLCFNQNSGEFVVSYVESNSEAANFGLSVGDCVLSIGTTQLKDLELEQVLDLTRGPHGESVGVEASRSGETATYTLTYRVQNRDKVFSTLVLGQAGYVQIRSFEEGTKEALKSAIDQLISSGAEALLFDVRKLESLNFAEAVECVDVIAGMTDLARVYTKGETLEVLQGDGGSVPLDCAVLIDSETCGAAELFAASLKDSVAAKLVGNKSFGRAGVQADIQLNDKSAIILTTKVYLPPVSESFDGIGITPDLSVSNDIDFRALSYELDLVISESYFLLKPEKRPSGEPPVIIPPDGDVDNPSLIEPEQ